MDKPVKKETETSVVPGKGFLMLNLIFLSLLEMKPKNSLIISVVLEHSVQLGLYSGVWNVIGNQPLT